LLTPKVSMVKPKGGRDGAHWVVPFCQGDVGQLAFNLVRVQPALAKKGEGPITGARWAKKKTARFPKPRNDCPAVRTPCWKRRRTTDPESGPGVAV